MPSNFPDSQDSEPRSVVRVVKQRIADGHKHPPEDDWLAIEDPLEISLAEAGGIHPPEPLLVTMRTPSADDALIHGLLFSEGIIQAADDIELINYTARSGSSAAVKATVVLRGGLAEMCSVKARKVNVSASCGVCGSPALEQLAIDPSLKLQDATRVEAEWLHGLPTQMRKVQSVFEQTGGLHAAAIFDADGKLLVSQEDIGRHNALDKAIGTLLQKNILYAPGRVLCVSGRMSYEIIQKALRARITIVAGVGAPSSLAVALANDFNMTLIGFLNEQRANIYSCPERIIPAQ